MTVVYRTQAVATNKIEILSDNDVEECLGSVLKTVTFVSRGQIYGKGNMRFATKEEVASHSTTILRREEITPLHT